MTKELIKEIVYIIQDELIEATCYADSGEFPQYYSDGFNSKYKEILSILTFENIEKLLKENNL